MGWFDEQIRQRKQNDADVYEESFLHLADAVLGSRLAAALNDQRTITKDAIDEILKYYHVKSREIPDSISDVNEQLEYLLRPYGIMRREARLQKGWYKDAIGPMLAQKKDGEITALIPTGFTGYSYFDAATGKRIKINKQNEDLFEADALCFYKPFPLKKLSIPDLCLYMLRSLSPADYASVVLATLAATLIGMFMPALNNLLLSDVISRGSISLLISVTACMVCIVISNTFINAIKGMLTARLNTKLDLSVQAATMMRVLSLPADFFKQYGSGELAARMANMNTLCSMILDTVLSAGLTGVFSLAYIVQIFHYTPALVAPAMAIILITVMFTVVSTFMQMHITEKQLIISSKESGMSYSMITGVQKIKLSGAEKRMFARWANLYADEAKLLYNPPRFIMFNTVISSAITLIGTVFLYSAAIRSNVSTADYFAFNVAYGMVSGAFMQIAGVALTIARIKPTLEMIKPVMDTQPEVSEGKVVLERISGGIELNNVSFRYTETMPNVIDDLTLKIKPGQYVAIVGTTGCGKSTLIRLMLGFEKPQKGAIYYDGKDLESIDLRSLRRKIGSVMQNGGLLSGDIYSNITISAPWLTLDEAWEAAETAGFADDIRNMPMGMFTMISEGQGGISGGQKQRLMIARAIAPKPKILIFDEATSALDNITQRKVSEALDALKCTRIVVAHRLSTIRNCDRIIVLDKGKIIEDGTYEELIANQGFFAELVERQRLDVDTSDKQ